MDAKLVVVGGEARVPEVNLELPLTVGRGRSSGLALPHPLVSRQHCEIYEEQSKLVINDLGSLNGTFVGDQRINEPTFLMPGELLTIGTVTFRAVYELVGGNDADPDEEESTRFDVSGVEEAVEVELSDVEGPNELKVVDEAEITEPIDIAETIPAPTKPGPTKPKPVAKPTQPKPANSEQAGSRVGAPQTKAVAADLEVAEEIEEVDFAAANDIVAVDEDASPAAAGHDTKEVSPASGDTEAVEGDEDDLQSFLQGLG